MARLRGPCFAWRAGHAALHFDVVVGRWLTDTAVSPFTLVLTCTVYAQLMSQCRHTLHPTIGHSESRSHRRLDESLVNGRQWGFEERMEHTGANLPLLILEYETARSG